MGYQTANQVGPGAGVVGWAETGVGVGAVSRNNVALYTQSLNNLAARFDGDVEVRGSLSVIGGAKSAVVPHRDGTHRQLYCVESPESWFEDVGEARVRKGICRVKLDPDFAALVATSDYQVFLTSYDPVPLYVSKRTTTSFEIRIMGDAGVSTANAVHCAYRIVARRKDIKAPRLPKVRLASAPIELAIPKKRTIRAESTPKRIKVKLAKPKLRAATAVPPPPKPPKPQVLGTKTRR
jgi:hypothetical protein